MHYCKTQKFALCLLAGMALAMPSLAFAQVGGVDIFGMLGFLIELFKKGQELFGYLFALMGIIAMGFGVFNIVQHFRTESRDDPNQKSRLVFGLVSFICGVFLAGGAYQTIGSNTTFQAPAGSGSGSTSVIVQEYEYHV